MTTEQKQPQVQKKSRKVWNTVINVLLIAVVVFGILCAYTAFISKRGSGVPDLFGLRFFSIQSDSMEDEFYEGDLIVDVRVKDPSKLEVNDVITFWTVINGERVLNSHRIIEKEQKESADGSYWYFTTQGDNSPDKDPLGVHESSIEGKYVFAVPKFGYAIDFLQTSTGFLCVIVLPVFLFFIYNLVQFFRVFFDYRMKKMRLQLQQEMMQTGGVQAINNPDLGKTAGLTNGTTQESTPPAAPAEATEDEAAESDEDAPAEEPEEATTAPAEAAEETPAEATEEVTAEAAEETPAEAVDETPAEAVDETPAEAVDETPAEAVDETPAEAVDETPAEAVDETPAEAVDETPAEAAEETPAEAAEETPAEAAEETPAEAVEEDKTN